MCAADTDKTKSVSSAPILAIAILVFLVTLTTGVHRKTQDEIFVYEAENAIKIIAEFEKQKNPDASSGSVLSIAQGKGRGWKQEAEGSAEYNIRINKSGDYWLWLRAYWRSGCENAIYLQANTDRKIVGGNDSVFNQWHWVKCGPLNFHTGNNKLFLLNHSDGVMLDKFELSQSADYKPEGFGSEVKHFFDGFGGCDGNNAGSWIALSGDWQITGDSVTNQDGHGAVFMQLADGKAVTITEQIKLTDFHIQLAISPGESGKVGVVFTQNKSPVPCELIWNKAGQLIFTGKDTDDPIIIGSTPRLTGVWCYWDLLYKDGMLSIKINDEQIGKPLKAIINSCNFGLTTESCPFSSFDNIRIDCINE